MKDKNEYGRNLLSIETAHDELMDKSLNAILAHFNIKKTYWIEMVKFWSIEK